MNFRADDILGAFHATLGSNAMRPFIELRAKAARASWNTLTIEISLYDRDGLAQVVSWPTKIRVADPITRRVECTKKRSKKS